MIVASVGVGNDGNPEKAGKEACLQALSGLPNNHADLLIVFASVSYDQDRIIAAIAATSPDTLLVGCSTSGEISSEAFSSEGSVVVMGIASDQMRFWGSASEHMISEPEHAGEEFANTLDYDSHGYASSCLLFLDIISGHGEQALRGVLRRAGPKYSVYGGGAADDQLFFETYQYFRNKSYSGAIAGVGFSGDFRVVGVSKHGFLPIGISRKVTRAEGNTLYELDGKPASSVYEEYFGEEHLHELHEGLLPALAVSYPLGIFVPDSNDVVLRNPVFVDQKGAMTFSAEIPENTEVRLMISDIERAFETAEEAAKDVIKQLGGTRPKAVVVVSSVARKKMLGPRADEEIEIIQRVFGRDVPIAGYYSYAQVGGFGKEMPLHNGSILIWALAE